jgi:phosphatidylserine/phosphatidylglycerophosphate/cardiolipin synthase-like enzyme
VYPEIQILNTIGTFAEMSCLIRSSTQVFYDHLKDPHDLFWKWLLLIRKFLRFINMQTITETQLILMDATLEELMTLRLYLTKVKDVEVQESTNENESNIDKTNDNKKKTNNKKKKKKN